MWACPYEARHGRTCTRSGSSKLGPAVGPKDCAVRSREKHSCINLLNQCADSLGYCLGRGKSLGEGLHVLVGLVISRQALEILRPAV